MAAAGEGVSRDRGGRGEGREVRWAPGVMLMRMLMWMGRGWERRRRRLLTLEYLALFVCQVWAVERERLRALRQV